MSDKLCPFCGSETETNPVSGDPWINCVRPGCVLSKEHTKYGINRVTWNTRPREAELEQALAEMTAEAASEAKWANEYMEQVVSPERQLAEMRKAAQRLINELNDTMIDWAADGIGNTNAACIRLRRNELKALADMKATK